MVRIILDGIAMSLEFNDKEPYNIINKGENFMKRKYKFFLILTINVILLFILIFVNGKYILMPTNAIIVNKIIENEENSRFKDLLSRELNQNVYVYGVVIRWEFDDGVIVIIYKDQDKITHTEEKIIKDEDYFMLAEQSQVNISIILRCVIIVIIMMMITTIIMYKKNAVQKEKKTRGNIKL